MPVAGCFSELRLLLLRLSILSQAPFLFLWLGSFQLVSAELTSSGHVAPLMGVRESRSCYTPALANNPGLAFSQAKILLLNRRCTQALNR